MLEFNHNILNVKFHFDGAVSMSLLVVIIAGLLFGGYGFWRWNTQPEIIFVDAVLPKNFPEESFSHKNFAALLEKFVEKNGEVNYEQWTQQPLAITDLDQYLAAVAKYSPENQPQRFNTRNDRLVYWVYAYNAQVIKSILSNWPLSSVTDLKAPVEIIQGLGFFYKRKFIFGGIAYSLYQIENGKIFDGQSDPRVHFILNCGSQSCPVLRPQLPVGDDLEAFLQQAAVGFVNDISNLRIDHKNRILFLSSIFKWNKSDFVNTTNFQHENEGLVGYLKSITNELQRKELERARNYEIIFIDYDWSLNQFDENVSNKLIESSH